MHELGIAQDTLDLALSAAQRQGATRITRLNLEVGLLSGVVPEALQFALETIIAGTIAEQAVVHIENLKPVCRCATCGLEFDVVAYVYTCPTCGSTDTTVVQGTEMRLLSLEVD